MGGRRKGRVYGLDSQAYAYKINPSSSASYGDSGIEKIRGTVVACYPKKRNKTVQLKQLNMQKETSQLRYISVKPNPNTLALVTSPSFDEITSGREDWSQTRQSVFFTSIPLLFFFLLE
ncbi:hypothetical protein M5K25_015597 [Dendrobium thyrsiflorum]|uniref:Uncharacterized protein n=1 Tax=Dendrobium thyrsiflorum TaxID=117978 RepID=A0ABD0UR82_DENTH